ncbi:Predicted enzyme with a TIM-barrel fold [Actinomyces bovis]|uniref:Pyridoxal phosphate homeostasis protein n=1 Tax=Actinomyces bovis TaxID=1658 RepID=A0ABY1VLF7_9ACTO|nr:YggS family pyridoxal phosphate-dependent enzyme [Actinomyces bovis]SPT52502.1 Predicted enzyme with a TIM-barrel fold [Actinomyces bovis]VEG54218.1 Predicted enzyme with a TIM-barrel fold [Actinomyces israelii]
MTFLNPAAASAQSPLPPVASVEEVRARLAAVQARVAAAATAAGREPSEIAVLPVTKTVPEATLRLAAAAGVTRMAENKVQEARAKAEAMADLVITWSLIGHLQTNKAREVATFASELQSLDSLRLAEALDRRLQAAGRSLEVYVQVNTSAEQSKSGLAPTEVPSFLKALAAYASLRVVGLMTIAANTEADARVRACFRLLRELRDQALDAGTVGAGRLSMGMSGDLEAAVAEGSTCVRVGQAIFGARRYPQAH